MVLVVELKVILPVVPVVSSPRFQIKVVVPSMFLGGFGSTGITEAEPTLYS